MKFGSLVFLGFLISTSVFAAKPNAFLEKNNKSIAVQDSPTDVSAILSVLSLPENILNEKVSDFSKEQLPLFKKIAFDETQSVDIRWRALAVGARVNHQLFSGEIEKAFKAKEWFMRIAALNALENLNDKKRIFMARQLLQDKALVVRTAAADVLMESKDGDDRQQLWTSVFDAKNTHHGKSLWIRKRVLKHLSETVVESDIPNLVKVLKDSDAILVDISFKSLDQNKGLQYGITGATPQIRKAKWIAWGESYEQKTSLNK